MHGSLIPRVTDTSTLIVSIDSNLVPNNVYTATLITVNVQGSVNSTGLIQFSKLTGIALVNELPHWNAIVVSTPHSQNSMHGTVEFRDSVCSILWL